jgi:hypothetical protein
MKNKNMESLLLRFTKSLDSLTFIKEEIGRFGRD